MVVRDLSKVADALPGSASRNGLQLISASVGGETGLQAFLSPDRYDADAVVQLAAACGARILYMDLDHFDANEFDVLFADEEDEPTLPTDDGTRGSIPAALRQQADELLAAARRRTDALEAVRIAFVVEGVVHEWQLSAAWADDLHAQHASLTDELQQAHHEQSESDEPDPLEVKRIAGLLQQMPTVISASSHSLRCAAAEEAFPPPNGNDDWRHRRLLQQALTLAQQAIQKDAADIYRTIENALDDTAARLLNQGALDDVHDAPARRILVTDFLTELTGGHRPKPRTVTLLLGRPAVKEFLAQQKSAAKNEAQQALPL
ncbi:hypothetical protein ACFV06_21320 [Streptomyces sp. NPDC059618]|uniref:hypothetical protein n=1 Tax=Streptomyces sp. NPDC059618 TaxID=3346887 RepID=UPI00367FA2CD